MAARSPFPGMDPWLEAHWGDVHHRLIQYGSDQITAQLPQDLYAAVEETVYVIDEDWRRRTVRPDVGVFDSGETPGLPTSGREASAAEPLLLPIPDEPVTLGHIEVRDARRGDQLVTAIEVLSPANKLSPYGRAQYLRKRQAYRDSGASVVEIDLLRAGDLIVDVPEACRDLPEMNAPYRCCVRRGHEHKPTDIEFYPLSLRQRLPTISLPLRATDRDILVDLQAPLDQAYERGRYGLRLDYRTPPDPPLFPDDLAWAMEQVGGRGG